MLTETRRRYGWAMRLPSTMTNSGTVIEFAEAVLGAGSMFLRTGAP
jgi:hypothetical protein